VAAAGDSESGRISSGGGRDSGGGCDTMRPAADVTWRPEMTAVFGSDSYGLWLLLLFIYRTL